MCVFHNIFTMYTFLIPNNYFFKKKNYPNALCIIKLLLYKQKSLMKLNIIVYNFSRLVYKKDFIMIRKKNENFNFSMHLDLS